MGGFVEVARTGDLPDGTMMKATVSGQEILLARAGDGYYASQLRCPHLGGMLARGTLQGTIVTCPLHHSQFDLVDGRVVRWTDWSGVTLAVGKRLRAPRPLRVYPVRVEGDRVLVKVE